MVKLKKFKERKLTNKNIIISFVIILLFMIALVMSKSYAIYKMQKEFDVIKSKIGTFTNGDVKVAVLVDGKETNKFPSYETNYKIESVECTNGVTGSFDVENWQVTISDMKATSTKCTVSFNSNETNEITPINMSKKDLIALNETLTDTFKTNLKKEILNETYPVGSIYMSTEDDTIEKVQNKFGGTWVRYAEDTTLVGYKENTNKVNDTGGSKTVTLTTDNLPSHSHYFSATTSKGGSHTHNLTGPAGHGYGISINEGTTQSSSVSFIIVADRVNQSNYYGKMTVDEQGLHNHTVSGNTGSTGSSKKFSVQNPYTVVYMYKRTA